MYSNRYEWESRHKKLIRLWDIWHQSKHFHNQSGNDEDAQVTIQGIALSNIIYPIICPLFQFIIHEIYVYITITNKPNFRRKKQIYTFKKPNITYIMYITHHRLYNIWMLICPKMPFRYKIWWAEPQNKLQYVCVVKDHGQECHLMLYIHHICSENSWIMCDTLLGSKVKQGLPGSTRGQFTEVIP